MRDAEKLAEVKEKIESARREVEEVNPAVAPGMKVDDIVQDEDLDEDAEEVPGKKPPPRKTQSQRKKAARLLAEVNSSCVKSCLI